MPCEKCINGKYKWGKTDECEYDTLEECEKANEGKAKMSTEKFKACDMIGTMRFMVEGVDLEKYRIPVILSDESEVVRYGWSEGKYFLTLRHGEENIDLSRKDILSLFVNHNTYDLPIGKFEDVRIEDNKLKAWAVFDNEDDASMKIFRKLAKGFLQSFSVGIDVINKELVKEEDGVKYYDVTKWGINEASVVGIPAIPTAKVGLNKEEDGVNRAEVKALATNQNSEQGNSMEYTKEKFEALKADHAKALDDKEKTALSDERNRVSGIMKLGANAEFTQKAIDEGMSVGDAAIALVGSQRESMQKLKTDFEKAAGEVAEVAESERQEVNLSKEEQLKKEADEAIENYGKGK